MLSLTIAWLHVEEKALVPSTPAVVPSRQVRAPMTKAEWEKQQSIIRRVHDPTTGRDRSILPVIVAHSLVETYSLVETPSLWDRCRLYRN